MRTMYGRLTAALVSYLMVAGLFLGALALALAAMGCSHSNPKIVYDTVEVKVPVPQYIPIELPDPPEMETKTTDPDDAREYIRAMVRDMIRMWAHITRIHWIVEKANEAARDSD